MYEWARMTDRERAVALDARIEKGHPWHSPPSLHSNDHWYHIVAACYRHKPIAGKSDQRIREFSVALIGMLNDYSATCSAWCVLPNHYHLLVCSRDLSGLRQAIGKLHGRSSHEWNRQDGCIGRRVWTPCADRVIRSERHYWATINYIHNNAVRHGLVRKWEEWEFSSTSAFLAEVGREDALRIWEEYPILDYGKGWDDP